MVIESLPKIFKRLFSEKYDSAHDRDGENRCQSIAVSFARFVRVALRRTTSTGYVVTCVVPDMVICLYLYCVIVQIPKGALKSMLNQCTW